jgi:hypothetical protein
VPEDDLLLVWGARDSGTAQYSFFASRFDSAAGEVLTTDLYTGEYGDGQLKGVAAQVDDDGGVHLAWKQEPQGIFAASFGDHPESAGVPLLVRAGPQPWWDLAVGIDGTGAGWLAWSEQPDPAAPPNLVVGRVGQEEILGKEVLQSEFESIPEPVLARGPGGALLAAWIDSASQVGHSRIVFRCIDGGGE